MLFELVEAQALIDRIRAFNRSGHPILVSNPLVIGDELPLATLEDVIHTSSIAVEATPAGGRLQATARPREIQPMRLSAR